MMRKTIYTFVLALLSAGLFAQEYVVHKELGQAWGGGAEVDIDADGNLDFYIAGNKNNPPEPFLDGDGNPIDANEDGVADTTERWQRLYMYTDNGFEETTTNLRVTERANFDWADIDGDGLVDLFAAEHSYGDPWYHGGIYTNNGDGTFTKTNWPLFEKTNAGAFADFNNDGHWDYVGISSDSAGSFVYMNNGDDTFEQTNGDVFGEYKFGIPYLTVIDFNNDGLTDIFITSNCDNPAVNGDARVIADIFINNDEEPGTFYRAFIGDNGVFQKGNGGLDIADFNGDGYMDFAMHGEGGAGTGEPGAGVNEWVCISHVYLNQQDGTFLDKPQPEFRADLRPLNSSGVATRTIDWDNDGNYDLILSGWEPEVSTQSGYLYKGDGAGNFTNAGRVPGGSETVILFNDWNGDGVLDFLASGHCWDDMWYAEEEVGRTAAVYFNTNDPNTRPDAPANLSADAEYEWVTLSWDAATDAETNANSLTYEIYIKDSDGNYVIAPASKADGTRLILKHGRQFTNTEITIYDLPVGEYTWSVQAIDAAYAGSAFADEGTFIMRAVGVQESVLESMLNVYTQNETLVVNLEAAGQGRVAVYNISGQEIVSSNIAGEFRTNLDSGIYFVKVMHNNETAVRKVLVAK
jgi:hypothetical protein